MISALGAEGPGFDPRSSPFVSHKNSEPRTPMIILVATSLSLLMITLSYMRRNRMKPSSPEQNEELETYFMLRANGASTQQQTRQLLKAAVSIRERLLELEEEMEPLNRLHEERMIGEEHWERVNAEIKRLELEKMYVESEADLIKPGFGNDVFREAAKSSSTGSLRKRSKRSGEPSLHAVRKEALEAELMKKLTGKIK
jgi:translocation protein SEC66